MVRITFERKLYEIAHDSLYFSFSSATRLAMSQNKGCCQCGSWNEHDMKLSHSQSMMYIQCKKEVIFVLSQCKLGLICYHSIIYLITNTEITARMALRDLMILLGGKAVNLFRGLLLDTW